MKIPILFLSDDYKIINFTCPLCWINKKNYKPNLHTMQSISYIMFPSAVTLPCTLIPDDELWFTTPNRLPLWHNWPLFYRKLPTVLPMCSLGTCCSSIARTHFTKRFYELLNQILLNTYCLLRNDNDKIRSQFCHNTSCATILCANLWPDCDIRKKE